MAPGFELAQGLGGGGDLPVAFGIAQVEALAERFGQSGARERRFRIEQGMHERNVIGLSQELFDGDGRIHPQRR